MPISEGGINAILLMVEASAPQVSPASVSFLPDFSEYLKKKRELPGVHPAAADSSATAFMNAVASEIGLALLAGIAKSVLIELRKKVAEKGANTLWEFLQSKINGTKSVQDLSNEISLKLTLPKSIGPEQVKLVVSLQLQALAQSPAIAEQVRLK